VLGPKIRATHTRDTDPAPTPTLLREGPRHRSSSYHVEEAFFKRSNNSFSKASRQFLNCGQPPALAILHSQDIALKLSIAAEDLGAWSQTVKTLGAGWTDTFVYFILLPIRSG